MIKTWIASEFAQPDGTIWWPMKGVLLEEKHETGFEWFVKSVSFNESLSRADFAAPGGTPGKTKIIDYLNLDVSRVGVESKGSSNTPQQDSVSPSRSDPTAAFPSSSRWVWLLSASVALLVVGVVLRFGRRNRN